MDDVSTVASAATATEAPSTESANAPVESFQQTDIGTATTARVVENPETGERDVEYGNSGNSESGASAFQNIQVEAPQSNYYSSEELTAALQSNNIDGARVSPEQQVQLQALANAYNQQAQRQAQQQQIIQQAQAQRFQMEQQTLANMQEQARQAAIKELGLTKDDMDTLPYMDDDDERKVNLNAKTQANLMKMQEGFYRQKFQQEQQAREYGTNMQRLSNFCHNEQQNEPAFQAILKSLDSQMGDVPYKIGARMKQAEQNILAGKCTADDYNLFNQAYAEAKKAYYAQQRGVSTIPKRTNAPRVERGGVPHIENTQFNAANLRGLNPSDREAAVQAWFKTRI